MKQILNAKWCKYWRHLATMATWLCLVDFQSELWQLCQVCKQRIRHRLAPTIALQPLHIALTAAKLENVSNQHGSWDSETRIDWESTVDNFTGQDFPDDSWILDWGSWRFGIPCYTIDVIILYDYCMYLSYIVICRAGAAQFKIQPARLEDGAGDTHFAVLRPHRCRTFWSLSNQASWATVNFTAQLDGNIFTVNNNPARSRSIQAEKATEYGRTVWWYNLI